MNFEFRSYCILFPKCAFQKHRKNEDETFRVRGPLIRKELVKTEAGLDLFNSVDNTHFLGNFVVLFNTV